MYVSYEQVETEIKNKWKNMKYTGKILIKYMQDLYNENYQILVRKIKKNTK